MKLWLVTRTDTPDYDEFAAFVVRAVSRSAAIGIAHNREPGPPRRVWQAEHVLAGGPETGVILADFRAG